MKFMNLNKWLYSNPMEQAGEDDKSGGGGQGQEQQQQSQAPTIDYDALAAAIVKAQKPADQDKEKSRLDKLREEDDKKKAEQDRIHEIENEVRFRDNFDKFVNDHNKVLGRSAQEFRVAVGDLQGKEKDEALKALVAKQALSNPELKKFILDKDKAQVEKILASNETAINGSKAWVIMQDALSVMNKVGVTDVQRGLGGQQDAPNITAFAEKLKFKVANEGKGGFVY